MNPIIPISPIGKEVLLKNSMCIDLDSIINLDNTILKS
jgi:hypothetical protein